MGFICHSFCVFLVFKTCEKKVFKCVTMSKETGNKLLCLIYFCASLYWI